MQFTHLTGATTSHANQKAVIQVQHYMCNKSKYAAYVQALQNHHDNKRQYSDAEQSLASNALHAQLHGNELTKGAKQARSLRTALEGSTLQSSLDMDAS